MIAEVLPVAVLRRVVAAAQVLPRPHPMRLGLEQQSALPCVTPWPPRAGPQRRRKKNGSRSRASARKARALLTGRCEVSALPARCLRRCLGVSIQSLFVVASEPPLHCLPSDSSSNRGSSRSSSSRQSGSAPAPAPAPLRPHRPGLAWQCACSEVPACGHGGLPCATLTHRSSGEQLLRVPAADLLLLVHGAQAQALALALALDQPGKTSTSLTVGALHNTCILSCCSGCGIGSAR